MNWIADASTIHLVEIVLVTFLAVWLVAGLIKK